MSRDNRSTDLPEFMPMSVQAPGDEEWASFIGTELVVLLLAELTYHHKTTIVMWRRARNSFIFFSGRWRRRPEKASEKGWVMAVRTMAVVGTMVGTVVTEWALVGTVVGTVARRREEKEMWRGLTRIGGVSRWWRRWRSEQAGEEW